MAQSNVRAHYTGPKTHEGGMASRIDAAEQLRRSVMTTMLWEDGFYEDGEAIADRIVRLTKEVGPNLAQSIMLEAKRDQKLRHAPLLIAVALAESGGLKKEHVDEVVTRADDLSEFLSLYWRNGRRPIDHQVRKGLALAFRKFDEYQLAKYNRDRAIKLRDVLRLVRPKPTDEAQAALWGRLIRGKLATPDTWEVALSSGANKKETFERLLTEKKLGDLAMIRNLRNMVQSGVDPGLIKQEMVKRHWVRMLPFQFVAAARHVPALEPSIEEAMLGAMDGLDKIEGRVAILVDGSGSMSNPLSVKSEMNRFDAACGLAILAREVCKDVEVYRFDYSVQLVPARRGFALRDALGSPNGGTHMWTAIREVGSKARRRLVIVITDEETTDNGNAAQANVDLLAIINVSNSQNGVGYGKGSIHINGWSEHVVGYLQQYLKATSQ